MSVSPHEVAARIRAEAHARERSAEARAAELGARLGDAAALLRAAGATRVWVFGSLATGKTRPESDIDLAVEGLHPGRYFDVLADLMALFRSPVDLVTMEQAPTSLRETIRATGREL
ncbi:MAG TPA: nucleotidyltransferase domain-containing protein [Kofleriaceae bacterium]|nr:nucleotidyltransferase domain-containing protein [Kofleriaceae bacterium]